MPPAEPQVTDLSIKSAQLKSGLVTEAGPNAPDPLPEREPTPSVSRGIKFAIAGRLVSMVFQGVASIILGRVLLPADFGLVNFSGIITGFVSRFNDMGVESAVIQRATIEPRTLSTAYSVKLAIRLSFSKPLTRSF